MSREIRDWIRDWSEELRFSFFVTGVAAVSAGAYLFDYRSGLIATGVLLIGVTENWL